MNVMRRLNQLLLILLLLNSCVGDISSLDSSDSLNENLPPETGETKSPIIGDDNQSDVIDVIEDEQCTIQSSPLDSIEIAHIAEDTSRELNPTRSISSKMDRCFEQMNIDSPKNFAEAIEFAIDTYLTQARNNEFSEYIFGLYQAKNFTTPVSLTSSKMCETTDIYFTGGTSASRRESAHDFSNLQNRFSEVFNELKTQYTESLKCPNQISYQKLKKNNLKKFFFAVMASLAQHESLSTADTSTSYQRAIEFSQYYGVSNFSKPPGVKFYFDPYQTNPHSARNMGLFQFSADKSGNILPCLNSWNQTFGNSHSACRISTSSNKEAFQILGASDQIFNAFCGVSKLVQSFGIQVNATIFETSSGRRRTSNLNRKNGSLIHSSQRCVTPFAAPSNTYNHFGTLAHTVRSSNSSNTSRVINEILNSLNLD